MHYNCAVKRCNYIFFLTNANQDNCEMKFESTTILDEVWLATSLIIVVHLREGPNIWLVLWFYKIASGEWDNKEKSVGSQIYQVHRDKRTYKVMEAEWIWVSIGLNGRWGLWLTWNSLFSFFVALNLFLL